MLRELVASQRLISSWPLYQTGIEALTRSIRAINHRGGSNKRAMTVGDLLMSPIQRLTKYPLLFADLHKITPVIDCPDSHAELDLTVLHLRELVREINHATDNRIVRERIRMRWLLQELLAFKDETLRVGQFGMLGHPVLCGVLHLAYQTKTQVRGAYGLCILFETHMILAVPARQAEKFDVVAVIDMLDLKIESAKVMRIASSPILTKLTIYRPTVPCRIVFVEDRLRIGSAIVRGHPQRVLGSRRRPMEAFYG
jgi:hypothetical protein